VVAGTNIEGTVAVEEFKKEQKDAVEIFGEGVFF